ncbi:MAG: oxidoreductase, partial [Culicoidibacterales bacterium]
VTNEESMQNCVNTIIDKEGRIDVLVNNAGYGSYGAVEDVPMSEARRQIEVNIFGLARMTQLVLPHMRNQKSGKIVNISSIGGKVYTLLGAWYHATKHAVEGFSDALRLEVAPFGIDVIIIEPGSIKTEWSGIAADNIDETSKAGAYKEVAEKVAQTMRNFDGSPATVISKTIGKAVTARKPKTRYAVGKYAGTFLGMRKLTTDRMFDRMIMSFYK